MSHRRRCRERLLRAASGALAVLSFVGMAAAAEGDPVTAFGLTFPPQIGGGTLANPRDYEAKFPGFGHGVEYRKPGWRINAFIYDRRQSNIPDDLNGPTLTAEYNQSKKDVQDHVGPGKYQSVKLVRSYVLSRDNQQRFRCTLFEIVTSSAETNDSFLCLTAWNGKFLKFRMTTAHRDGSNNDVRLFLGNWISKLWPTPSSGADNGGADGGAGGGGNPRP